MRTRPATAADTEFLRDLHHRAYRDVVLRQFGVWDEAAQDHWFAIELSELALSVVEVGGEPVGAIASREDANGLELVELQILPEWQGRGLGSALLRTELERAAQLQKPLYLRVLLENRARSLYERHGFVITGRTETHYLMAWRPQPPNAPR